MSIAHVKAPVDSKAADVSSKSNHPDWSQLLIDAVNQPGIISSAYSRFWNYSVGNQILAMIQCMMRRIEPGPIHTFKGWQEFGRQVKKGEKALTLCMPVQVKQKCSEQIEPIRGGDASRSVTLLVRVVWCPKILPLKPSPCLSIDRALVRFVSDPGRRLRSH